MLGYGQLRRAQVYFYYLQRKASRAAGATSSTRLDEAFKALATLDVAKAKALLEDKALMAPPHLATWGYHGYHGWIPGDPPWRRLKAA